MSHLASLRLAFRRHGRRCRGSRAGAVVLAGGLSLALAACGGVGAKGGTPAGGSAGLTTMGFGLPDEIATTRVAAFQKAHPDVKLTINQGQFDEQAFLSSVASGNPPDVVYLSREMLGTYAARGAIQPLDDCVAKQGIATGDFYPAAQQQVRLAGKWYGMPEFYNSIVLLVNDKAAKEAGADPAKIDASDWDGLSALAKKMNKVSGGKIERFGFYPKLPEFLPLWAKANGADLMTADGRTSQLTDPKVIEALTYANGLLKEQGGWTRLKAFTDTFDYFGEKNPVTQDQIGMMLTEQFLITSMANTSPDARITVLPFEDRQGHPISNVGGNAWAIPKGARNPDAACQWIKTMTSADTWIAAAKARAAKRAQEGKVYTGTYTGNAKADKVIFSQIVRPSGHEPYDNAIKTILAAQAEGLVVPPSPAAAEFRTAWLDAATRVMQGRAEPQAALLQAHGEAQRALRGAG
ncbi:extracellular solute-binding protein [Planotetraspora sp. A-T 1434]|uniref:ABC transporter substrate-binding protein n=1 Tax=Planotetraspora sp. A-T 1434 TaxID=2979219 RepID=UPI0021C08757|nr:extracellular solute-binding protein [Planotetraspora sp. A-T 1434]MCT9931124.1 extracellular solute-binding protein [Planotetraspora sp. A-T 1434]